MPPRRRLLLIGWDSADWEIIHPLLDQGKLHGVQQLVDGGVSGELTTPGPQLPPVRWTSVVNGNTARHHGVHGFTAVDPLSGGEVPVSAASRRCRTVWEMLGESGLRSHLVGWPATQGEQDLNGKMVSPQFGQLAGVMPEMLPAAWPEPPAGTYWPPELAADMHGLRVSPLEMSGNDILRACGPEADPPSDRRRRQLAEKLAHAHSLQSVATYLMETDPDWDFMAVCFPAVDEIAPLFRPAPPPQGGGIPDADFQSYQDVVTRSYRAHDLMLQRLIHLAGPATAVVLVSDRGSHRDPLRPEFPPHVPAGPPDWHRPQGLIMAYGPGFKQDALIHGAGLLDIAPTVLHYFGLPVGADLPGRVLSEAFRDARPVAFIPTWENPGGC